MQTVAMVVMIVGIAVLILGAAMVFADEDFAFGVIVVGLVLFIGGGSWSSHLHDVAENEAAVAVRIAAAERADTSADDFLRLAQDPDERVRSAVAASVNPAAALAQVQLAEDELSGVRLAVAANPAAPLEAFTVLAADPDPDVVLALVANPAVPADVINPAVGFGLPAPATG